jgi:hypothetical protein
MAISTIGPAGVIGTTAATAILAIGAISEIIIVTDAPKDPMNNEQRRPRRPPPRAYILEALFWAELFFWLSSYLPSCFQKLMSEPDRLSRDTAVCSPPALTAGSLMAYEYVAYAFQILSLPATLWDALLAAFPRPTPPKDLGPFNSTALLINPLRFATG